TVTVGQAGVPAVVLVHDVGDQFASNVLATLIVRRKATGEELCRSGGPTRTVCPLLAIERVGAHPTTVLPNAAATAFPFRVDVSADAVAEEWVVSARLDADRGGVVPEIAVPLQRVWILQTVPHLVVQHPLT